MARVLPPWPGRAVELPGGLSLFFREAGPERAQHVPTMVLVHGLGGSSTNWTTLMAELRDQARLLAPDLPGFGESAPAWDGQHSVGSQALAVAAFLQTLGGPVHLVGNSMGGLVGVLVAARRPELVTTLTLVSPAMPYVRVPSAARWLALLSLPRVGESLLMRGNAAPVEQQVRRLARAIYAEPDALTPEQVAAAVDERRRRLEQPHANSVFLSSLRSVTRHYLALPWRSAWSEARRIECPTLVMYGARDLLVSRPAGRRWRSAVPGVRLVSLPTTGHVPMMERPEVVACLIREQLHGGMNGARDTVGSDDRTNARPDSGAMMTP